MRALSPIKVISHALRSVMSYPQVAMRIGLFWIPLLFVFDIVQFWVGGPSPQSPNLDAPRLVQFAAAAVGILAVSSMAVSWHRFILRDELGTPSRLDGYVWRYAGNVLLIMLIVLFPIIAVAVALVFLPAAASLLLVPVALLAGVAFYRLSIRLPAVALGRGDFSLRDAWKISEGYLWPILGVFLLNTAILLGALLALMAIVAGFSAISEPIALAAALLLGAFVKLFFTLFNASVFTSLYGFFVEGREF